MEKKENNLTDSGYHLDQYYEFFEVPMVVYLVFDNNNAKIDQDKLKAVETLRAQFSNNLVEPFMPEGITLFVYMWRTIIGEEGECAQHLKFSLKSTEKLFDEDINIYELVDLATTQLKNIKRYNSNTINLLQAENLNEVTWLEMSNHYSSFFKGIKSMNMKLNILRYHLTHPQRHLNALVDRFSAMVEGELRQYEEELETIRAKVFQLLKEKTNLFGLRWLPDAWKEPVLSVGMKN
ncbi:hypothetical protein ACLB2K_033060 [Fragaria x ananassa]